MSGASFPMDGMTRSQLDEAERKEVSIGHGPMRPRDAATLILLDRKAGDIRVLMGRRHASHVFMPGKFVFPGGRTDPADGRVKISEGLHPEVERKLLASCPSPARARAIALSALRETYEEAGLLIGRAGDFATARPDWRGFAEHGVRPALDRLRFVARAITPPGRVRRYDTRFLAAFREDVAVELAEGGPSDELEEIAWLPIGDAREKDDLPSITRTVLGELQARLEKDPDLSPDGPVPFYRFRGKHFRRDIL